MGGAREEIGAQLLAVHLEGNVGKAKDIADRGLVSPKRVMLASDGNKRLHRVIPLDLPFDLLLKPQVK